MTTYLDLELCPFSHAEHQNGGKPSIIVNDDGSWGFHCFHPDCATRTRKDLEELYGPLVPIIKLGPDIDRIVEQYVKVLPNDDNIFQRANILSQIVRDAPMPKHCLTDNGAAKCSPIPAPLMKVKLASVATCKKWNDKKAEYVRCTPPDDIVNAVLASGPYADVPVLVNVVSAPILRIDGTIASKPGYDPDTGVYLDIEGDYPALMPVNNAIALLNDILCDFPFASENHRSAAIANLISLLARHAYRGSTPIFIHDANMPGVGKGMLTDLITTISENRKASRYDFPAAKDELSKIITAVAMSGVPYLLFDNVKDKLGGKTLENAITTGRWTGRILGLSRAVDLSLNIIWMATSNNARLTIDMIRRACHIRQETNLEHPDKRNDFRHPDLLDYVKEQRRELAIAALSIPANYIKAGRPKQNISAWGGFQDWSDLIRQSIVWAGLPDPDTRESLIESADDERLLLRQLIDGWGELGGPSTVGDAITLAPTKAMTLQNVIDGLQGDRHRALGYLLRDYRGRVCNGKKLERTGNKIPRWQVVEVKEIIKSKAQQ